MPRWFLQLRNVVWIAVFALLAGFISMASGLLSDNLGVVIGFGFYGLIMATLAPKS